MCLSPTLMLEKSFLKFSPPLNCFELLTYSLGYRPLPSGFLLKVQSLSFSSLSSRVISQKPVASAFISMC